MVASGSKPCCRRRQASSCRLRISLIASLVKRSPKTQKNISMRTNLARFPFVKSVDSFDFGYQPSLDKKQLTQLATCHFIEHARMSSF